MKTLFRFDLAKEIGLEKLQCVECKKSLKITKPKKLICANNHTFQIKNNIPLLLSKDSDFFLRASKVSSFGKSMKEEYEISRKAKMKQFIKTITNTPDLLLRMFDSDIYLDKLTDNENPGKFVVSVGGGPVRKRATVINLNIDMYPNVDIIGDAHNLPFKNNSVDGILIYAVFEHLERPDLAVAEIYRVLKKGGLVFAETPFLQHYHGYPFHFQNYTITGHEYLFRKFTVLKSGPIGGPFGTIATLLLNLPEDLITNKYLRKIILYILGVFLLPIRALDIFFKNNRNTFKLTSGTYIFARKD